MKATRAEPRRDRLADPAGGLITADNRSQYRLAADTVAFSQRQRNRGERRAGMNDVAKVAVIRRSGVAHHRIRLRGIGNRHAGAGIEPQRRLRPTAALARQLADDCRGGKLRSRRCAGDGAGDKHRRMVERLRRQIGHRYASEEVGQLPGNGHRTFLRFISAAGWTALRADGKWRRCRLPSWFRRPSSQCPLRVVVDLFLALPQGFDFGFRQQFGSR